MAVRGRTNFYYYTKMKYNKNFYNYIKPTLEKLQEIIGDEFVVFGLVPLYLLEIAQSGDFCYN